MNQQNSPDEKLLKLIRKKDKSKNKSGQPAQPSAAGKPSKQEDKKKIGGIFLKSVNRILFILLILIFGYGIFQVYSLVNQGEVETIQVDLPVREITVKQNLIPKPRAVDEYLQAVSARDIFQSPWDQPDTQEQISAVDSTDSSLNSLMIIGVIMDDDPKVILADSVTGRSIFLSEGQKLNGAVVEKITESKVILNSNGKRVEITK